MALPKRTVSNRAKSSAENSGSLQKQQVCPSRKCQSNSRIFPVSILILRDIAISKSPFVLLWSLVFLQRFFDKRINEVQPLTIFFAGAFVTEQDIDGKNQLVIAEQTVNVTGGNTGFARVVH